jgi:biopolymer transport protein ExbB
MLSHFNWVQLVSTSPITIVILGCSVVTFGIAIERAYYFWKRRGNVDAILAGVKQKLCSGDMKEAIWAVNSSLHPVARVALRLLESPKQDKDALEEQMHIALSEQKMLLERNLVVLGTMAVMAPLVGLLGTVWGIMRAFNDMALTGSAAPSIVAAGVAEALITTAAGLCIAVPALMLYNHFTQRMNVMLTVAENHALDVRSALIEAQAQAFGRADERAKQQTLRRPDRESREEAPELVGARNRDEKRETSWAR